MRGLRIGGVVTTGRVKDGLGGGGTGREDSLISSGFSVGTSV